MVDEVPSLIVACFSAPGETLWANDLPILTPYLASGALVTTEAPLDRNRIRFGNPFAGGAHEAVAVLYAPKSAPRTTVMLTNAEDGWITLAHGRATSSPGLHCGIRSTSGEYPLHAMEVWSGGQSVRYVRAMKDPRWDFFERGSRLEFEDPVLYEQRLIRRRLDRATLIRYLAATGWNIRDGSFWETSRPARYVEQRFRPLQSRPPGQ
jgi:hypothetical protein